MIRPYLAKASLGRPSAWCARLAALNGSNGVLYFVAVPRASGGGGNPHETT